MRIVFVIAEPNNSGGVRTVAMYAKKLSNRGHDVIVISTPPPAPTLKNCLKSLVRHRRWPGKPMETRLFYRSQRVQSHRSSRPNSLAANFFDVTHCSQAG